MLVGYIEDLFDKIINQSLSKLSSYFSKEFIRNFVSDGPATLIRFMKERKMFPEISNKKVVETCVYRCCEI